jgi:hypothetical protein
VHAIIITQLSLLKYVPSFFLHWTRSASQYGYTMIQGVGAGGNADDGEEPMVDTRDVTVPVDTRDVMGAPVGTRDVTVPVDTRDVMGVPVGTRDVTVPVDTVVVAGAPRTPIAAAAMKAKRLNCMMAIRLNWVDELSL